MSSLYIYPNQNNALLTWRRESLDGKDYIVAQSVPLVEGVLNGRFVSAEEFGAFVNDWNGVPVVLRHPKENDGSARVPEPDVPVIGRFYGAKMDGSRLVGEYWLEADKLDIAYTFEENEWNGERKYQLNIKDIKYADK